MSFQNKPVAESSAVAVDASSDVLVVGAGPVGQRFVELYARQCPQKSLRWFGNEPWQPYDRIKLTPLLSGAIDYESVFTSQLPQGENLEYVFNCGIVRIDREQRFVEDEFGRRHGFRQLVLATGSSPHIPEIPGVDAKRVYTFRNLKDVASLKARTTASRHTVIIGAGLLGLEAARAMLSYSTRVTVVQQAQHIMNRQLDSAAAKRLQDILEEQGVCFSLGSGVREIVVRRNGLERDEVAGVRLRSSEVIPCDTVIVCAGIKPNIELAIDARLPVSTGIRVNSRMQTADPSIYAIGECAQYENEIAGLVGPGLEQASVLVHNLAGDAAQYKGYISATTLKVVGEQVFSVGDVQEELQDDQVRSMRWSSQGRYRKVFFKKGKLVGAIAIGDWPETYQLIEHVREGRKVALWRRWLFLLTGNLFDERDAEDILSWPAEAVVCHCKQVPQSQIVQACQQQKSTSFITQQTGAGSVCGSCRPLLDRLTGTEADSRHRGSLLPLTLFGTLSMLIVMVFLGVAPFPYSSSFAESFPLDSLWLDSFYKQVSGFSMLFIAVLTLFLTLSKRWNGFRLGKFVFWRNTHAVLGVLALLLLFLHTGMHFGVNLNRWLMMDFMLLAALGGFAAFVASQSRMLPFTLAARVRRSVNNLHILAFWPLPVLLCFHILASYYF